MTTIAEKKVEIEDQIKNLAQSILAGRKEAIDLMELAQEMLEDGNVLDSDLPALALHYGQQRTILKGRSAADALKHDINSVGTYSQGHDLTLPSTTQWGYVLLDSAGSEITSFDPADHYLTKVLSDDRLATLEADPGAYATPVVAQTDELMGIGPVIGAKDGWTASTEYKPGNLVQPTVPNGFFYRTTVGGNSNSVEPSWPTTIGQTVSDGGITWICEGREQQEWTASTSYRAGQPVYPATAMGSFFQISPLKQVEATHGGSPDFLTLAAAVLQPNAVGNKPALSGNWQRTFGPATAISTFGFNYASGTNRVVVVAVAVKDSTDSTPVRTVTYGGRSLNKITTVEASLSPGFSRIELWYLLEADLALVDGNDVVVIDFQTDPDGVGAFAAATYQNVDQTTPFLTSATSSEPTAANPVSTTVGIAPNTHQIAVAWSGTDGGFTWEPEWTRRVNVASIPSDVGSMSVADSDDVIGTSGSSEPSWPSASGATTTDGNVVWVNEGSTVFSRTVAADEMVPGTVAILVDGVTVATDDGAGAISPVSGLDDVDSGSVHYTTGVVNVTFKIPPELGELVFVQHDAVIGIDDWRTQYSQLSFSVGTKSFGSSDQYTLRIATVDSAELVVKPKLLDTMEVRNSTDHSVLGTMVIIAEGLRADESWDHLSDPAGDATVVSDSEFEMLLGWLDPSGADDIAKGADPDLVSNSVEVSAGSYPNIETNPMFPSTDGKHADLQPGSLTGEDAFAGSYAHVEDRGSGDEVRWYVLPGLKFLFELEPTSGELLSQPENPDPENPDELGTALQNVISFGPSTSSFPLRIPADVAGGDGNITFAAVGAGGGAGNTYVGWSSVSEWGDTTSYSLGDFVRPSTGDTGFVFECTTAGTSDSVEPSWSRVNGATTSDGGMVWTCRSDVSGEFACYYNQVQHLIDQAFGIAYIQSQMDKLSALGAPTNTVDPSQQKSDDQFETDQETFETDLDGFVSSDHGTTVTGGYNPLDSANRVGGGGNDYPQAEIETNLAGAATTFQTDLDARVSEINSDVLGADVVSSTAGLDYARRLYNAVNKAVNFRTGYVREVKDKLATVETIYTLITQFQEDYASYP